MNLKGTPTKLAVSVSRKKSDNEYGSFEVAATLEVNLAPDADLEQAFDELDTLLTTMVGTSMQDKQKKISKSAPQQQPLPEPEEEFIPANWCPIHQCEMKMHQKDNSTWYSHKVGDAWCKGK